MCLFLIRCLCAKFHKNMDYSSRREIRKALITAELFVWQPFTMGETAMQMLKETSDSQIVYRLRSSELDEVIGEAVVSGSAFEVRLHGIFVRQNFRGRGYGGVLMHAVLNYGEDRRVTLCTGLGNIGFFERFGFVVTEVGESLVSMERTP